MISMGSVRQHTRHLAARVDAAGEDLIAGQGKNGTILFRKLEKL
jgi:hypothetical protein